ncbi:hypothetical protein Tco_1017059 [Tanacetum coccineum]|uniref:Uncharacterized protein n=1 Tax=Tanacetum coccineum TaxID=301880 RepID=A0ABQ5FQX9_9ASTR
MRLASRLTDPLCALVRLETFRTLPAPLSIVPVSPVAPCRPDILVLTGQEIPFGRPYRIHPNGVRMLLTTRKRVHSFPAAYRLTTSIASNTPTSVGPSHKRCRSPATSLSTTALSSVALVLVRADRLPSRKRFRDSSAPSHQEVSIEDSTEAGTEGGIEVTIQDAVEPDISPFLPEQTVIEKLDEHEKAIQGMHNNLIEMTIMRFEELEEDQKTLKDRAETVETKRTNLRERVRSLEIGGLSLQDTLRAKREAYARIERQLGFVTEELRHCRMAHFTDKESLRRIETFLCRRFDYRLQICCITGYVIG